MRKREGMFFHGTAKKLVAAVAVAGLVLTGFSTTAVAAETPVEETKIELAEEDATEIFSGDTNESYESSDASWLMKAADDDVITVVYTCTEKANAGWGVLGWGATINDAWKDGPSLSSSEKNATDEMVATMTVADFKKTMGITDSSVVSFIKLGAWNGGKIISLTVSGAENAPKVEGAEEIVIEGPKELNPADYLYLLDTNWLAAHENNFRLWPGAFLPGWNPGVTIYVTMEFESNGPFMGAYGTCVNVPGDPWAWQMEVFNSGSDNDLTCTWFLTPRLDYMDIGIWWMGGTQLGIKSIKVEKAIDYSGPAVVDEDDDDDTPTRAPYAGNANASYSGYIDLTTTGDWTNNVVSYNDLIGNVDPTTITSIVFNGEASVQVGYNSTSGWTQFDGITTHTATAIDFAPENYYLQIGCGPLTNKRVTWDVYTNGATPAVDPSQGNTDPNVKVLNYTLTKDTTTTEVIDLNAALPNLAVGDQVKITAEATGDISTGWYGYSFNVGINSDTDSDPLTNAVWTQESFETWGSEDLTKSFTITVPYASGNNAQLQSYSVQGSDIAVKLTFEKL
ncbi:MAG: hypothetical protein IJ282_03915 [Lachnospiraceae bacterium]|nr:hypothetical protein [Lachnospiraceae bacterium]